MLQVHTNYCMCTATRLVPCTLLQMRLVCAANVQSAQVLADVLLASVHRQYLGSRYLEISLC